MINTARIWSGEGSSRAGLMSSTPTGNNPVGFSILPLRDRFSQIMRTIFGGK